MGIKGRLRVGIPLILTFRKWWQRVMALGCFVTALPLDYTKGLKRKTKQKKKALERKSCMSTSMISSVSCSVFVSFFPQNRVILMILSNFIMMTEIVQRVAHSYTVIRQKWVSKVYPRFAFKKDQNHTLIRLTIFDYSYDFGPGNSNCMW